MSLIYNGDISGLEQMLHTRIDYLCSVRSERGSDPVRGECSNTRQLFHWIQLSRCYSITVNVCLMSASPCGQQDMSVT